MKVDQHISELLYDHDCVIVPSFGGFLASYNHARIHQSQHTFSPPSKKIAFNIFLKQNDGLLANHLVKHEKLSYTDALNQIERHVNFWNKELTEGRKLIIDRIGVFYFDAEKNLQFDPVKNINYLRDAFGLETVQYLPVKREDYQQKVEKHVKGILRPSAKQEKQPLKLSKKTKQKILSTLIISGTLLWFSFNLYLITPHRLDLSSLNPFASKNNSETIKPEAKSGEKQITPASSAKVETVYVANAAPVNPSVTQPKEPSAVPVPSATASTDQKYFVIAGAFQFRENADAFVKSLQAEGFSDARILDTSSHLKKVCFKGFSTQAEAAEELDRLKAINKSGWIYKW